MTKQPAENNIPEWVTEDSEELKYYLDVVEAGGTHAEDIELDRDEFLMLKRCLAIHRGHLKDRAATA